jgi:3-oxoacyl-[acyl-carrier protein] reductase
LPSLKGKVSLITGSTSGIGLGIARALAGAGSDVVLNGFGKPEEIEAARASVAKDFGVHVDYSGADMSNPASIAEMIETTLRKFGRLDVLVNNAGSTTRGDFLTLSESDWADGFGLKFFGAMRLSRAAWPHLQASRGTIVNIVGIGGRTGTSEFAIGGAVNAALLNLTKVLADRGVKDGVRVNAINPGGIATDRLQTRLEKFAAEHHVDLPAAEQQMARALGVARFGRPEEIARLVAFLASPQASFCQGSIVDADGGQTRTL